jgi:hypothetical protein
MRKISFRGKQTNNKSKLRIPSEAQVSNMVTKTPLSKRPTKPWCRTGAKFNMQSWILKNCKTWEAIILHWEITIRPQSTLLINFSMIANSWTMTRVVSRKKARLRWECTIMISRSKTGRIFNHRTQRNSYLMMETSKILKAKRHHYNKQAHWCWVATNLKSQCKRWINIISLPSKSRQTHYQKPRWSNSGKPISTWVPWNRLMQQKATCISSWTHWTQVYLKLNRNRETSKFHDMKVGLGWTRRQNSTLKQQIDSSFLPEKFNLTKNMKPKWKEDSNSAALETLTKPSSRKSNFIFIKVMPKKTQRTVVRRMLKKVIIWSLDWTRAVTYHSKRRISRRETW